MRWGGDAEKEFRRIGWTEERERAAARESLKHCDKEKTKEGLQQETIHSHLKTFTLFLSNTHKVLYRPLNLNNCNLLLLSDK